MLVKTLVHWVLMICSLNKLEQEFILIREIFYDLGYPLDIVQSSINVKIAYFFRPKHFGFEKCPV